jgi:hypothetical protein
VLDDEPLGEVEARQLVRKIVHEGTLFFSRHVREDSMPDRGITEDQVVRCLRRGVCTNVTFERGSWRYTMEVPDLAVVVAFRTVDQAVVVTVWRVR